MEHPTTARHQLGVLQRRTQTMDILIEETKRNIRNLQDLLQNQVAQRDELFGSIEPLQEQIRVEDLEGTAASSQNPVNGGADGANDGFEVSGGVQQQEDYINFKSGNVKIPLPPTIQISDADSALTTEGPFSPPPSAVSPPPHMNRLFAGHTPSIPLAISAPATPNAAIPSKPIGPISDNGTSDTIGVLPKRLNLHDPPTNEPLTARDEEFMNEVVSKLEAVAVEEEREQRDGRGDSMSPDRGEEHGEDIDGIKLKSRRPVNFGAPLGKLK